MMRRVRIKAGDFWVDGDRLTAVPINATKKHSWLYRTWCRFAPKAWSRYRYRKSQQAFIQSIPEAWAYFGKPMAVDPYFVEKFGTPEHIFMEKIRVRLLPRLELNAMDFHSKETVRETIRRSILEVRNPPQ
jgi:hypothetical protein